jgi:hypothetical protein
VARFEDLAERQPDSADAGRTLAVGCFLLFRLLQEGGQPDEAAAALRRCHQTLRRMRAAGMDLDPQMAGLLQQLDVAASSAAPSIDAAVREADEALAAAEQAVEQGNRDAARSQLPRVIAALDALGADDPPDDERLATAVSLFCTRLGKVLLALDEGTAARDALAQALAIDLRRQAQRPDDAEVVHSVAISHLDLARVHARLAETDEAGRHFLEAVGAFLRLHQQQPDDAGIGRALVLTAYEACGFLLRHDAGEEAVPLLNLQLRVLRRMRDAGMPLDEPLPQLLGQLEQMAAAADDEPAAE